MNTPTRRRAESAARSAAEKNRPLMEDIRLLGRILGDTIREQEGKEAFELVERVRAAATALGYVPDPAARALASSRSSHVAVLIPKLSNTLFVELLDAVQRTLVTAGYQTLIGVTQYDAGEEEAVLRSMLAHRPAGLIVTGSSRSAAAQAMIDGSGVPCVRVMEVGQDEGGHSVGFSQRDAGRDYPVVLTTGRLDAVTKDQLFRKVSLDLLASPEQLDQPSGLGSPDSMRTLPSAARAITPA